MRDEDQRGIFIAVEIKTGQYHLRCLADLTVSRLTVFACPDRSTSMNQSRRYVRPCVRILPMFILLFMTGVTCSVALGQSTVVAPPFRGPISLPPPPITGTTLNPTRTDLPRKIDTNTTVRPAPNQITAGPPARSAEPVTASRAEPVSSGGGAPSPEVEGSGDSDSESPRQQGLVASGAQDDAN